MLNHSNMFENLESDKHFCFFYEEETEHKKVITDFLISGLNNNEKVVYISDTHKPEVIIEYLREFNIDTDKYIKKAQLIFLNTLDTYLNENDCFVPDSMIELLNNQIELALSEGYSALRITGEMVWVTKNLPGSEKINEYEFKADSLINKSKCIALCQYNVKKIDPLILFDVYFSHKKIIIGNKFYNNINYLTLEDIKDHDIHKTIIKKLLLNFKTSEFCSIQNSNIPSQNLNKDDKISIINSKKKDFIFPIPSKANVDFIYKPSKLVSGDFLFFHKTDENCVLGFLGDIIGSGITAGLNISALKILFLENVLTSNEPLDFLNKINNKYRFYLDDSYAAVLCFKIDFKNKTLTYAGAGINKFFYYNNKEFLMKKIKGPFLGMFNKNLFEQKSISFSKNDIFYFFTDGFEELLLDNNSDLYKKLLSDNIDSIIENSINLKDDLLLSKIKII
jgi:hypothetical protein